MPEIEINGETKKVACGPCIRGHRSSKCTHKDRVLIEVRKPGRPLSACPHPSGSCGCERMVVNYTLPKTQHCGSCTSGTTSSSSLPNARVQKGKSRKPGSNLTPSTLQRAISSDGSITLHHAIAAPPAPISAHDVPKMSPNGAAGGATNIGEESAESDSPPHPLNYAPTGSKADDPPGPLRLGLFGVGGARARDEIGWSEPYPDMYNVQYEQNGVSRHLTAPNGAAANAKDDTESATGGSCCAPRNDEERVNGSSPETGGGKAPLANDAGAPATARYQPNHPGGPPYVSAVPNGDSGGAAHDCNCGEGCACLACLTHPRNKTTLDYVRYHTDLVMRYDGIFSPPSMAGAPSSPHTPEVHRAAAAFTGSEPWTHGGFNAAMVAGSDPSWESNSTIQATPTQELGHLQLQSSQPAEQTNPAATNKVTTPPSNGHPPSHAPSTPAFDFSRLEGGSNFDSNSPQQSGETPTLSPSAFFIQSYTLPGCDDATGTCQCGDGCTCVGCLTHTGHQTTQQDQPASGSYHSHGSGCACPPPDQDQSSNTPMPDVRAARQQQGAIPYMNGHHSTTPTSYVSTPSQSTAPVSTFTHVHGPNCACPVDGAVLQAQAKVQAHAQLHGPQCRCPTGMTYLTAQLQAEARLHQQLHGNSAPAWVNGLPG